MIPTFSAQVTDLSHTKRSEQNLENETLQILQSLEDQVIAMGQQLDRLVVSTELSSGLIAPATAPARAYFECKSQQPPPSIIDCFSNLRKKLLIVIDSELHEISLSFAFKPNRADFEPIKELCLYECCWLFKQLCVSEFRFGCVKICDLKAISWTVAMAYTNLGYSCRIQCGAELIEVDELIAETRPSPLWLQLQEVELYA